MNEHRNGRSGQDKRRWWTTDCPYCQRLRLYAIWAVLMFLVYWYVF